MQVSPAEQLTAVCAEPAAGRVARVDSVARRPAIRQLAVVLIILVGAAIRLGHLAVIDVRFPFRYGGLFVEFAQQIARAGYRLPRQIPFYTEGGIPFAYPPLPFYFEAALIFGLGWGKFAVANLLPPLIAILALPSFYLLAREAGLPFRTRLLSLLAFATIPAAFSQQVEAGGLAESPGSVALLWLAIAALRAHRRSSVGSHLWLGLATAVCIVTSPGAAYGALPMVLIFAAVQLWRPTSGSRVRALGLLAAAGLVTLLASSPYWLAVMANHGLEVFAVPFAAQHGSVSSMLAFIAEWLLSGGIPGTWVGMLWNVAIWAGLVWAFSRRRWALLAWFAAMFLIPRESMWLVAAPAALLAGQGAESCGHILVRMVRRRLPHLQPRLIGPSFALLLILYALWCPADYIRQALASDDRSISGGTVAAMEWAGQNTPADARFIVLSRPQVKEWAPQIARRTVLNELYGAEWEPAECHTIAKLEDQLDACRGLDCVLAAVEQRMGRDDIYLLADRDWLARITTGQGEEGGGAAFTLLWQNDEMAVAHLCRRAAE